MDATTVAIHLAKDAFELGTGRRPVVVQGQAVPPRGKAMDRMFARRAFVLICRRVVDEFPLVEPALGLAVRCERLGHQRDDARLLALQDLHRVEVAKIGQHGHARGTEGILGLLRHGRELGPIMAVIGDILGDNLVVFGIQCCLDLVVHRTRSATALGHRTRVRVRQRFGDLARPEAAAHPSRDFAHGL